MTYIRVPKRRQQIVDAAIEVIAEFGLAGATTRKIAERADAPLGSLHYCFENKAQLIDLIVEEGISMMAKSFAHVDPSEGLEKTIRSDIDALWNWYRSNIGLQLALMELGMNRIREGALRGNAYDMWDHFGRNLMLDHLTEALKLDDAKLNRPLEEIVRFILHRFDGLTLELAASRDEKACAKQVDMLADLMVYAALGADRNEASLGAGNG